MERLTPEQVALSALDFACGSNRRRPNDADLPSRGEGQRIANRMEAFWIATLHEAFRSIYGARAGATVEVFSKAQAATGWNRNEFLHDITVLERGTVKSPYCEIAVPVARRILWQVESDLGNGRDIAIDFSKLIAGSAENKLLIVAEPKDGISEGYERMCRFVSEMAVACSGSLFLAFVPRYDHAHSRQWIENHELPFSLFALSRVSQFVPVEIAAG